MKRLMALLIAGAYLLAACGDDNNDPTRNLATPDTGGVRPSTQAATQAAATQPTGSATAASTLPVDSDGNAPGIPEVTGDIKEVDATSPYDNSTLTIKYIDEVVGTGDEVKNSAATVTVHYTGWLTDGTKFDSSVDRGEPATFALTGVIPGWTNGVPGMKVGGKRRLIIPAGLAYGPQGRPSIPGGATLIFDIELISIQ